MSQESRARGLYCLVCGRPVPAQMRGRRQLYCSDRCIMTGQRRQQVQSGKVSGHAARPPWLGGGSRPAPDKGQGGHADGAVSHKPRDLEAGDVGVA